MMRSLCTLLMVAFLFYFLACSEENTAGVTEEENSVTAFEVATPDSYDLWSFSDSHQVVGDENLGYWFSYGNAEDGDGARVVFAGTANTELSADDMATVVDSCGGLCGTVEFEKSSRPVSAGIGFTLGKDNSTLDVSSWNGLCVTYKSELAMNLKFRNGAENGADDESFVEFPKGKQFSTHCAKWEDFKQAHRKSASVESVVKKLGAILFEFRNEEKKNGSFNIKGVGSYKDFVWQQENPPSSSSMKKSSSSSVRNGAGTYPAASAENLWLGSDYVYRVETGLFDETMTGGYWYSIEDTDASEPSRIVWPVLKGNAYDAESLGPIIEHCGGLCGSFNFESNGFAGVGFSIVNRGENGESMKTGDITSWGGLCVKYSSSLNIDVVMNSAAQEEVSTLLQSPKVTLPSSDSLTTQCMEWDEFGAGDPSQVSSLLFVFEGDVGSEGDFNIVGLGTLADN